MQELLYNTQLTTERLSVVATKMINDVAQAKRNGNGIAIDILKSLLYCKGISITLDSIETGFQL